MEIKLKENDDLKLIRAKFYVVKSELRQLHKIQIEQHKELRKMYLNFPYAKSNIAHLQSELAKRANIITRETDLYHQLKMRKKMLFLSERAKAKVINIYEKTSRKWSIFALLKSSRWSLQKVFR